MLSRLIDQDEKGLNLFQIPPVVLEKMSVAMLLALPNLSHFVKAMALVSDKDKLMTIKTRYNNSNFKIAMMANIVHATGCTYNNIQKTLESIGLIYLSGSADSNTHTFSKLVEPSCLFVSFHQRKPTNSLPEIFFKFQKSAETSNVSTMK